MKTKNVLIPAMLFCGMQLQAEGLNYDFETDAADWSGRGDATIEVVSDRKNSGEKSLYVSNRSATWHGALFQNDYIESGKTYIYKASAFATSNMRISLSIQYSCDGSVSYNNVISSDVYAYDWKELSGEVIIPEDAEDIQPYIECSDAEQSFYLDDVSFVEKQEVLVDFSDQVSLKDLFAPYFKIGTAVTASEITPQNAKNMVLHHFNSVTPGNELKPDALLDQNASIEVGNNVNPQVKLTADTKTVLKFCEKYNIPIRGHVFVWHSQTPDWFFNEGFQNSGSLVSVEVMNQRMENYIRNVIDLVTTTYPDLKIYAWDIVNEAFHNDQGVMRNPGSNNQTSGNSLWMSIYGNNEFIYNAFSYAKKYIPKGCKMYYNDYNEYIEGKRDGIYALVKDLYEKELCDGIGMQSHLSTSYPSVDLYKQAVEKYAKIGCDIQITELDITLDGADFNTQAKMYKELFEVYKTYKDNISLVAFWGINDEISWRSEGQPLPFSNYQPKAAYYQIIEGMELPTTDCNPVEANESVASVYPTVTQSQVNIVCPGKFAYSILDAAGKTVSRGTAEDMAIVSLNGAAGIYVIETVSSAETSSFKVVKE